MKSLFIRLFALVFTIVLTGCASVKMEVAGATPATVEKLRASNMAPAMVGTFELAPGKEHFVDTQLGGLRGASLVPSKGTWSQHLKDTLITELTAARLYDTASRYVIEGQLIDSQVDAPAGTGTARLVARFMVKKEGSMVYDKEITADASWESSFMGAVAVPTAMNQYGALYKKLITKLVDDPAFRLVLAK